MSSLKARLLIGAALGAAAIGLAACGDDNKTATATPTPTPSPTPTPTARFAAFGTPFAASFDASPNTDAREPATGDVPAVSLTTEPADVA